MKKIILSIAASLYMLFSFAQETVDMAMMQKIKDEEKQHSQMEKIAHELMDGCGPRLTNSPGYKKAVDWAVQTLTQWGLQAAPEAWGEFGKGWGTEMVYAALSKPYYQPMIVHPFAWSNGTKGLQEAGVTMLDNLDSASIAAKGKELKGKIILLKEKDATIMDAFFAYAKRYPDTSLNNLPDMYMIGRDLISFYEKYLADQHQAKKLLAAKGAIALMRVNKDGRDGTLYVDGTVSWHKNFEPTLAEISVAPEDYFRIQRLLADNREVQVQLNIKNNWYNNDLTGYNVIGEIPGTDAALKNQVVIIGGHLDSWHSGTGATDNGAGCVVMMEAVRILKALGVQPKRTIRIALWGGEEQGLLGSFGYVKNHFGNPIDMKLKDEQKNISAYFNLDNGTGKIRGIYLQNNAAAKDIFSSWLQPFADKGATGVTMSNTGATDHLSFDAVGIPGFQFIQDPMEYETRTHHSNMDVYDHLSIPDLQQAAMVVAAFVYNAAMRNEMVPRKPLPKAERFVFDTDNPL